MSADHKIRVMVVDDSAVVRGMISKALQESAAIEVVGSAMNGKAALTIMQRTPVDVILLDVEMPEMDGITALPLMLKENPLVKVIMVSGLTQRNADISLHALELGAVDYIAKPVSRGDRSETEFFFREVVEKVLALGASKGRVANALENKGGMNATNTMRAFTNQTPTEAIGNTPTSVMQFIPHKDIRCIAIGSSTGGPQALLQVFRLLKNTKIKVPIFITQHMPATFTKILAEHITSAGDVVCEEGKHGAEVKAGHVYLAPGDYHMIPKMEGATLKITLNQDPPVNYCRPAVDPMFQALAQIYGKNLFAIVLTGMGQDGMEGAKAINARGGQVIAQNEATSVVWGMPGAVTKAGQAKAVLPLDEIPLAITKALA
jgi:two-component system chemotaxis response regulator CheB